MTPFLALALLLAPATATRDDGAEGCMAYGIYTDVVAVDGDTSFTVPAAPDGYDVTAVVIGDQSDPVQHEVVAPAVSGDIITVGYYIDHVHVCLAQTPPPEETWQTATTSTTTTTPPSPSSTMAAPGNSGTVPTSTNGGTSTESSTSSPTTSAAPIPAAPADTPTSSLATRSGPCLEDEPCWDCRTMGNRRCGKALPVTGPGDAVLPWAVLVTAAGGLLAMASRRRA